MSEIVLQQASGSSDAINISFPYSCDLFQLEAFESIKNKKNILVTAHTGSGKTTIGEFGILYTINYCKKNVCYTSPIKSLSNEKYNDFTKKFAKYDNINVGILTGDNKINPNGNCLIMTAEILRNSLYCQKGLDKKEIIHTIPPTFFENLGCVIMDEIHFINDADRGKVWEETLILLENNVQLILLSATIDNARQFADWIERIKERKVDLISTNFRAVPLKHYIYSNNKIHTIFENEFNHHAYITATEIKEVKIPQKKISNNSHKFVKNKKSEIIKSILSLVHFLRTHDLLQAIFFSFSKKKCERYASMINEQLLSVDEINQVTGLFNKYMYKYERQYERLEQYQVIKQLIFKGIAYHHSGLIPILKEIIEIIFSRGLIKVLFATETFAVGVNMPTRTVVFTELEKYTQKIKRLLTPTEYKQMSGRAGRRGIDKIGHVIILSDSVPDEIILKNIMLGRSQVIESKLKIDYGFVLKLYLSDANPEFIGSSLLALEYKNKQNILSIDIKRNEHRLAEYENKYLEQLDESVITYYNINNLFDANFHMSLSKNQQKQKTQLGKKIMSDPILKEQLEKYNEYNDLKQKNKNLQDNYEKMENDMSNQIKMIKEILVYRNYISDSKLSKKGIIAAQINDCNSIIVTELIVNGELIDLQVEEIIGFLAIFIDDEEDEDITINDIHVTPKLKELFKVIERIIENFYEDETYVGMYTDVAYWKINYSFVDYAYNWAKGEGKQNSLSAIYLGTFIKNILKINNMAQNLINLYKIDGNLDMIPKLEKINSLLVKDFVTINSLYL